MFSLNFRYRISIKMASHPCGGTIANKPTQCVALKLYIYMKI